MDGWMDGWMDRCGDQAQIVAGRDMSSPPKDHKPEAAATRPRRATERALRSILALERGVEDSDLYAWCKWETMWDGMVVCEKLSAQ